MFSTTTTCDDAPDFTGRMLARSAVAPPRGVWISISRFATVLPLLAAARINSGSGAGSELTEAFFNRAAFVCKCAAATAVQATMRSRAPDDNHAAGKVFLKQTRRISVRKSAGFLL